MKKCFGIYMYIICFLKMGLKCEIILCIYLLFVIMCLVWDRMCVFNLLYDGEGDKG